MFCWSVINSTHQWIYLTSLVTTHLLSNLPRRQSCSYNIIFFVTPIVTLIGFNHLISIITESVQPWIDSLRQKHAVLTYTQQTFLDWCVQLRPGLNVLFNSVFTSVKIIYTILVSNILVEENYWNYNCCVFIDRDYSCVENVQSIFLFKNYVPKVFIYSFFILNIQKNYQRWYIKSKPSNMALFQKLKIFCEITGFQTCFSNQFFFAFSPAILFLWTFENCIEF